MIGRSHKLTLVGIGAITIALSLCISSQTYATSHEIQGIQWYYPTVPLYESSVYFSNTVDVGVNFEVGYSPSSLSSQDYFKRLDVSDTSGKPFLSQSVYHPIYSDGVCSYNSIAPYALAPMGRINVSYNTLSLGFPFALNNNSGDGLPESGSTQDNVLKCNPSGLIPYSVDTSSVSTDLKTVIDSFNPYNYSSNGFSFSRRRYDYESGEFHYDDTFFSDIVGFPSQDSFSWLQLPLYNSDNDSISGHVRMFSSVEFSGKFVFPFRVGSVSVNPARSSNSSFDLVTYIINYDYSSSIWRTPCTTSYNSQDQEYSFTCLENSFHSQYDGIGFRAWYSYLDITSIDSSNNLVPFFLNGGDFAFEDFVMITDGDNTSSHPVNTNIRGKYQLSDISLNDFESGFDGALDDHWANYLANLFTFNITNPFSGLLAIFSDQSTCASIPTIAGMIHLEETTVCPWFDSQTRSIVTGVVSIFVPMLLFGFVIRWLGSSSGDYIDKGDK